MRDVPTFVRRRDFSAFICFLYALDIPGFNRLIDMLIEGPKPTPNSNLKKVVIEDGVTPELKEWVVNNTNVNNNYITIPKITLESLVENYTIEELRTKLGQDKTGSFIYDNPNITNIYLELRRGHIIVPQGYTCHPLYDSLDLDVEKYFKDPAKFFDLISLTAIHETNPVYKYSM
jgi:hypothetical protein